MLELNKVYHQNCFNLFPQIEDWSVDTIITDPPFEVTNLEFDKKSKINWDIFYQEMRRVLKPNGRFFLFGTLDMYKKASDYFTEYFTYIWVKNNIVLSTQASPKPYKKHEYLFCFIHDGLKRKGDLTFHRDELRTFGHDPYSASKGKKPRNDEYAKSIGALGQLGKDIDNREWRHGTSILEYPIQQRKDHCTVKPIDMIKLLLRGYTNESDLVLDPFMGTGTTAVACKELNRNYLGMEIEQKYYDMAIKRLESYKV